MTTSLRKKRVLSWIQRSQVNDVDPAETNIIDGLPESLLSLEIFSRLSNPRDVIVCKSVSKRWNSVLSSSFHYNKTFALILNTQPGPRATNETCLDSWKGFNLNNYVDPEFNHSPVCVLASYKDVLLCMKYHISRRKKRLQYYIVNPVTMRWTRLPKTREVLSIPPIGLSGNGSTGRYYVVKLLPPEPSALNLQVLDSKRGQWNVYSINYSPWSQSGWWPTNCQALNFNKSLHWLAHDGPIVAYNTKYKHKCIIIHRSQEMRHASYGDDAVVSETLTVSMGHLRIIQLVCYPFPNDHHHVSIWTLVDYKQSLWKKEHDSLYFRDMVSDTPWIQDYMREYNLETTKRHDMSFVMSIFIQKQPPEARERISFPHPLLCHLTNPLLVYLYLPERIVSLDVTTKSLRLVTKDIKRGIRAKFGRYELGYDMVIPMTLHLDPSLVLDHERELLTHSKRRRFVRYMT